MSSFSWSVAILPVKPVVESVALIRGCNPSFASGTGVCITLFFDPALRVEHSCFLPSSQMCLVTVFLPACQWIRFKRCFNGFLFPLWPIWKILPTAGRAQSLISYTCFHFCGSTLKPLTREEQLPHAWGNVWNGDLACVNGLIWVEVRTRPDGQPEYKHSPQSELSRCARKCLVKPPESALLPRHLAFHQNVTLGRIDSGSYQRSNSSLQEFLQVSLQSPAAKAAREVRCVGVSSFVGEPWEPNWNWQFLVCFICWILGLRH